MSAHGNWMYADPYAYAYSDSDGSSSSSSSATTTTSNSSRAPTPIAELPDSSCSSTTIPRRQQPTESFEHDAFLLPKDHPLAPTARLPDHRLSRAAPGAMLPWAISVPAPAPPPCRPQYHHYDDSGLIPASLTPGAHRRTGSAWCSLKRQTTASHTRRASSAVRARAPAVAGVREIGQGAGLMPVDERAPTACRSPSMNFDAILAGLTPLAPHERRVSGGGGSRGSRKYDKYSTGG
ncbi:hypothetical protein F4780DRAFT_780135 [Xylariomycetidae sp. FL0641]|nr:hypothetical protein F4780DRAFT_780135 [Xylariomycetidae sp. FL0641]